jgi:predicted transglutaminase-like cysteine proteinase
VTWSPAFDGWDATVKPADYDAAHDRTHEWTFRGRPREWELSVPVSTYEYCSNRHRVHEYGTYIADPVQQSMLDDLRDRFRRLGLDERSLLTAVVRFVQSVPYARDVEDTGHRAYPKYPAETFVHERGDCEDLTVLLGSILDGMGFDVAVVVFPDAQHMVLGVALDRDAGAFVEHDGVRYYTVETTDLGWDIGELPTAYRNASADVQRPDRAPVLVHEWEAVPASEGVVDVTTHVANVGTATAEPLAVQMAFEARNGDVVVRDRLNPPRDSLAAGDSAQYDGRLSLPTDRVLRGRLTVGVGGTVHDRSESEWH